MRVRKSGLQVFIWEGEGPSVLVMHGWSSHALRLSFLIEQLLTAGFRVLAFDAPGHGRSGGMRSDVTLFVDALRVVIAHVGGVHAIVGHSLGARAALLLLQEAHAPPVRALGVIATPPDVCHMLDQFKLILGLEASVCTLLDGRLGRKTGQLDVFRAEDLANLRMPVMVVHDEHDDVTPVAHAKRLAEQLPQCRLLVTRKLNHCGVLTDAAAVAELVGFLAGHSSAPSNLG